MRLNLLLKAGALLSLLAVILLSSFLLYQRTESRSFDLDQDGDQEKISLNSGLLRIWSDNREIFTSDITWDVTLFDTGDVNNDQKPEFLLGFWRYGDFGPANDYSRLRRDPKKSYHLYLYQYDLNAPNLRLIWGSSTLNDPIYSLEIININDKNYLDLTTGSYSQYDAWGKITGNAKSRWIWEDWYFSKLQDL
jgi:hypothetical protein